MDLVLKGRGHKLTERDRTAVARKLERLSRMEPRATRVELEVIAAHNPRLDGSRRLEAAFSIPRKTFRAHAEARDVDAALDQLVERLERQIRDHHGRRSRKRGAGGPNRLESAAPGRSERER
jgi:ribosomal subunit interface protein